MKSNEKYLIQICIPLTDEEKKIEEILHQKDDIELIVPPGFQIDIAWELANLTRIAYKDYELFNGLPLITEERKEWGYKISPEDRKDPKKSSKPDKFRDTFHQDTILYTSPKICSDRIDDYFIEQNTQKVTFISEAKKTYGEDLFQYRILATYNYLAYSFRGRSILPTPLPDVDNFGFIAERITKDHERIIFVIFRGTREPEEWFVNFQFKQKRFLMKKDEDNQDNYPQKISLGFNKIYTDYRPGLLQGEKIINSYSRYIDENVRKRSYDKYRTEHDLHTKPIVEIVEGTINNIFSDSLEQGKQPKNIYIAGHSLGAALATISGLHISRTLKEKANVSLYTFASPRVGNQDFAEECSKSFRTYRIANSEDIVPGIPPGVFKIVGQEMIPSNHISKIRKILDFITRGVTDDVYEHVGYPICFTSQLGGVSSNHNMNAVYCHALRSIRRK
jgi:hypothetical protein